MKKFKDSHLDFSIGSWLTIPSTETTEILSNSGFDWLTIDMEHSAITLDKAQAMIRIIELYQVTPLVRVGVNDPTLIKRVMDAGSHGVIVPMVNSKHDAEKAVGAVKYPPKGFRGVGLARAQKYGFGFEDYKKWNDKHSIVIVQIEHILAVENLREILEVDGVDGFIVGPYDLSASLGIPGQFDQKAVVDALQQINQVAGEYNILRGYHVVAPDPDLFKKKVGEGFNFIAYSLDSIILGNSCRQMLKDAKGCIYA
jgi:2-keto-3-deoxy-L-rhamnonate aldolase RhmA